MVNLDVREFSQAIINFINQSPIPIEIKRLCINDIATQLEEKANIQIEAELLARDQAGADSQEQEDIDELVEDSPKDSVEK